MASQSVYAKSERPRIVVFGMGNFGQYIVRLATQKGWHIVAAYNRKGSKVGQDVGQLSGLCKNLGVCVEDAESADFNSVQADLAVVTSGSNALSDNLPAYRKLLEAGLNVICHGIQAYYPTGNDPVLAREIDELARNHNVSFCGGGIWDATRIWPGILAAGPCTEIHSLTHRSISDSSRAGEKAMREAGTGVSMDEFKDKWMGQSAVASVYKTIPEQVLTALGYSVVNSAVAIEPAVFDHPIEAPYLNRVIPAGDPVGSRVICSVETREGVTATAEIEARLFWPDEEESIAWEVEGLPRTKIIMGREDNAHATISSLFNRIPDVIAAPPGVVTASQLGPMHHTALFSQKS